MTWITQAAAAPLPHPAQMGLIKFGRPGTGRRRSSHTYIPRPSSNVAVFPPSTSLLLLPTNTSHALVSRSVNKLVYDLVVQRLV